jgi:lipid-A-disaccharide synthase
VELFVSAGEASSDIHLARLLRELRAKAPETRAFGLGGDRLEAEGVELLMHNRVFSVMGGPLDVLPKIGARRKLELLVEQRLFERRKPDLAILVDNGEINLRLAALLKYFGVPVIYFIPPKVWVWRSWRIEKIAQHVDLVLGILPFEEPIYREWEIPFRYVGNPLADEVPTNLDVAEAKRRLGLEPGRDVIAVLPGSRHSEIRHHVAPFSEALRKFAEGLPADRRPVVAIAAAPAVDADALQADFARKMEGTGCEVRVYRGLSHECLKASRVALVKSGTSTLEAALLGVPMVLAYCSSRSSEWVYRHLVRYRGFVGMVNLFLAKRAASALGWEKTREEPVVPEIILDKFSPEAIAIELRKFYDEGPAREKMLSELARARGLIAAPGGRSPLSAAAGAIWELLDKREKKVEVAHAAP